MVLPRRARIWALAALVASGCALPQQIRIANNSGLEVRLHTDRTIGNDKWDERIVRIGPRKDRTLHFRKVLRYPERLVRVEVGGCDVAYEIPDTDWRHNASYSTLTLRLDPDLTIHQVLPKPGSDMSEQAVRHEGFPLKPVSRVCR